MKLSKEKVKAKVLEANRVPHDKELAPHVLHA